MVSSLVNLPFNPLVFSKKLLSLYDKLFLAHNMKKSEFSFVSLIFLNTYNTAESRKLDLYSIVQFPSISIPAK